MDFRACYCASLGSPFLEWPIPAKVNQDSNNKYFNQQSHTKGRFAKGSGQKQSYFLSELTAPVEIGSPGYNAALAQGKV
jgi:hypothetical protein